MLRALVPGYLILCLLFGGASAAGYLANAFLQFLAIALVAAALLTRQATPLQSPSQSLLGLIVMALALIGAQLVPLPPEIWTSLPGRKPIAAGYGQLGLALPWLPMSLAPQRTFSSALACLPGLAVLLAMLRLGAYKPAWIALVVILISCISIFLGALQVAGGAASWSYFYEITNVGATVGFFANCNHLATLLLMTIPFVGALFVTSTDHAKPHGSVVLAVLGTASVLIVVGIVVDGSLAGLGLALPVVGATAILVAASLARKVPRWAVLVVILSPPLIVLALLSAPLNGNYLMSEAAVSQNTRAEMLRTTLAASREFHTIGSGLGTFQQAFRRFESPESVTTTYVNHAHSDYAELWLETGIPGALLLLLFLAWWLRHTLQIWRAQCPSVWPRAATIASAAVFAHSLVDYPLRTAAISTLFAVCLALMAEAKSKPKPKRPQTQAAARHLSPD